MDFKNTSINPSILVIQWEWSQLVDVRKCVTLFTILTDLALL